MNTCIGCDRLIVEQDINTKSYYCAYLKKYVLVKKYDTENEETILPYPVKGCLYI